MNFLANIISSLAKNSSRAEKMISKEDIAEMLKVSPEALDVFENTYKIASECEPHDPNDLFAINSRQAVSQLLDNASGSNEKIEALITCIVEELLAETDTKCIKNVNTPVVTPDDIKIVPEELRPQLTGQYLKKDIDKPSYYVVLDMLHKSQTAKNPKEARKFYRMFRQGLDILDLDPIVYEIIGMNQNSIGYWFPVLEHATTMQTFFKIPKTKIVKIPLPLLQLTRFDFMSLTPTTIDIVNRWAYEAFELDENKTYFVKTGTYSSKFDFRNAKVTTPKEVRELGSYLLYIHFQALQMASPLSQPCIYGASTTNEWCVREYIEDKENNPCIYHGLPLHTEYRVFIDCDSNEVLGIAPYWKPDVMKKRFGEESDSEKIDMKHDYVTYLMYEDTLMSRYNSNKNLVVNKVLEMLPDIHLEGQWSLDVMQNGDDFWLIDMATADTSALNECVPKEKLKKTPENWIPNLSEDA